MEHHPIAIVWLLNIADGRVVPGGLDRVLRTIAQLWPWIQLTASMRLQIPESLKLAAHPADRPTCRCCILLLSRHKLLSRHMLLSSCMLLALSCVLNCDYVVVEQGLAVCNGVSRWIRLPYNLTAPDFDR